MEANEKPFTFPTAAVDTKVLLASHNRLLWYDWITGQTQILHQDKVKTALTAICHSHRSTMDATETCIGIIARTLGMQSGGNSTVSNVE